MKKIYFFCLIYSLIINFGCNSNKKNDNQEVNEAPPSISIQDSQNNYLKLADEQLKILNLKTIDVKKEFIEYYIEANGIVEPAPKNIAYVSTPISGRINTIYVNQGENVKKGQLLFEIESLEFGNLISELLQSKAELDFESSQLDRISKLTERKISSSSELEKIKSEYLKANVNYKASQSKLMAIGLNNSQIENLINGKDIEPHLKVFAPISGKIDKFNLELGKAVNSLENLMTIIDNSLVLIKGYVNPEDANLLNVGNKVCIYQKVNDFKICDQKINTINPALDEGNKSIVVNILSPTINDFPKPGLNVKLSISVKTQIPMFKIPKTACTYEGNQPIVYVQIKDNLFEKRYIQIYRNLNEFMIVSSGLKENEKIVTSQVFTLKALGRFEQFSE